MATKSRVPLGAIIAGPAVIGAGTLAGYLAGGIGLKAVTSIPAVRRHWESLTPEKRLQIALGTSTMASAASGMMATAAHNVFAEMLRRKYEDLSEENEKKEDERPEAVKKVAMIYKAAGFNG